MYVSAAHEHRDRVKRLAAEYGGSAKIDLNTVGRRVRFGTRRPRVQISPARPSALASLCRYRLTI